MKKIGFVIEKFFPRLGGMEYAAYFLAKHLYQLNSNIQVYCSAMVDVPGNYSYPFPVIRAKQLGPLTRFLYEYNVKKLVTKLSSEVLHGHMLHGGGYTATRLAKKYALASVVTSHGSDIQVEKSIAYGAVLDKAQAIKLDFTLENCTKIISPSQLNRTMLVDYGVEASKIINIPLGADLAGIANIPFVKYKTGFSDDDFIVIAVGRNSKIKRMELLIEAMQLIVKHTNKIKCLLVGPDDKIKHMIAEKKLSVFIKCVGRIPAKETQYAVVPPYYDLINLYRTADLYVSTSYMEAFNLSALDALACGTPVLVTSKQGIVDHIQEGINGYILNKENAESLSAQVLEIYEQRQKQAIDRMNIINSVSHLDWSNVAGLHCSLYEAL